MENRLDKDQLKWRVKGFIGLLRCDRVGLPRVKQLVVWCIVFLHLGAQASG